MLWKHFLDKDINPISACTNKSRVQSHIRTPEAIGRRYAEPGQAQTTLARHLRCFQVEQTHDQWNCEECWEQTKPMGRHWQPASSDTCEPSWFSAGKRSVIGHNMLHVLCASGQPSQAPSIVGYPFVN